MKVVVTIIGGRNSGKEFDLTQPPNDNAHYVLCEDDVLTFKVLTKEDRPNIHLALHEVFIPPTNVLAPNEHRPYFEYIWEPKRISYNNYRYESFFHNFCGLAELLIIDKIQTSFDDYEVEVLNQVHPIEVLARKINADRINAMLNFLARNDGRDLAALARITRKKSGFKEGDKTLTFTLDRIDEYLRFLEDALPKIVRKPISKLVKKNTIKPYTSNSNITEDSINHIISSPDCIYEVFDEDESLFSIDDRLFAVDTILETEIVDDTNLYENHVLHGFVEVLLIGIHDILQRLSEVKVPNNSANVQGYESLFNKLNQFNLRLNQPHILRCNEFKRRLSRIKWVLVSRVQVNTKFTGEPYFTHKAKQNLTYKKIFLMMIEWTRFGRPDWSLQNELNSIQDLSKLFEFYLYCVIKEHVLNYSLQFNGGLVASPIDGSNDSRFIFQVTEELKAELLYEPNIFHARAEDSILPMYCNTEAWKRGQDNRRFQTKGQNSSQEAIKDGFRLRKDSFNAQKKYRIRRTPDVILRLTDENSEMLLIIDAKYMITQKAFYEAMPECVIKYLHGIHLAETGQNTSIGLMIVNPDEDDITRHFHHDEYSIFSENPVTPAIMTASIDVSKAHKLNSTIQRNLFRFIELMALRLKPNSLEVIKNQVSDLYQEDVEDKYSSDLSKTLNSVKVENKSLPINQLSNTESILEPINDSTFVKSKAVKKEPTKRKSSKLVETAKMRQKGLVSTDLLRFSDSFETTHNSSHQFMSKKKKFSK